jgi:hypothetical protein
VRARPDDSLLPGPPVPAGHSSRLARACRPRLLALAVIAVLLLVGGAGSAVAASAGGAPDTSSAGIGGIVVPLGVQPGSDASAAPLAGTPNLTYHGGPVMHTNTTYAIYDLPAGSTMSASYQTLLNQFLTDVGVASGSTTNVYSTDTQYYDGSGPIAYSSAFGGAFVDTTHPIPDHCSSQYAAKHYTVTGCLLDTDIQAEIS